MGSGPNTKYSDELAEVLVATGTGKRAPADLGDFTTLETFVTDDDGNTVSRTTTAGTVSYEWDDFNNLLSVKLENGETTQNSYDADSIREEMVKDSGEKVKSFYSGLPTATETSTVNGNTSYFLGHQLLGYEKNGNSLYYITDGLSSVRAVIDSSGNEVSTFDSDEYGNELNATGTSLKTWVGGLGVHNDTADTRLLYMRRRHYDPKLGRFLSQDPIGLSGGLNLYSYGGNSPVNRVDYTGLQPRDPDRSVFTIDFESPYAPGLDDATIEKLESLLDLCDRRTDEEFEDCLAKCIEQYRFDWPAVGKAGSTALIGNAALNLTPLGRYPRAGFAGRAKGLPTSWTHRVFGLEMTKRFGKNGFTKFASSAGKGAGRLLSGATILEGFYDATILARCAASCRD